MTDKPQAPHALPATGGSYIRDARGQLIPVPDPAADPVKPDPVKPAPVKED